MKLQRKSQNTLEIKSALKNLERHAKALAENLGVNDYAESEYEVMIEEGKLKTQNPDANF